MTPQHNQAYERPKARESTSMLQSNSRFDWPSGYRSLPPVSGSVGVWEGVGHMVAVGVTNVGVAVGVAVAVALAVGTGVGVCTVAVGVGNSRVGEALGCAGSVGPTVVVAEGASVGTAVGTAVGGWVGVANGDSGGDWNSPPLAARSARNTNTHSKTPAKSHGSSLSAVRASR
jgi:hypothetical protein